MIGAAKCSAAARRLPECQAEPTGGSGGSEIWIAPVDEEEEVDGNNVASDGTHDLCRRPDPSETDRQGDKLAQVDRAKAGVSSQSLRHEPCPESD